MIGGSLPSADAKAVSPTSSARAPRFYPASGLGEIDRQRVSPYKAAMAASPAILSRRGPVGGLFLAMFGAATLGACGEATPSGGSARIAPGLAFPLPSPASLGRSIEVAQLIEAGRESNRIAGFEARLSVTPQRLLLVATDALGRRGLTASWDGVALSAEAAAWLPAELQAANMVGDIVLLFWPHEAIAPSLTSAGAELTSTAAIRSLRHGAREIVRIEYRPDRAGAWSGRSQYRNFAWGYTLDIRSREIGA